MHGAILFTTDSLGNQDYIEPGKNCILLSGCQVVDDYKIVKYFLHKDDLQMENYQKLGYKLGYKLLDNISDTHNKDK